MINLPRVFLLGLLALLVGCGEGGASGATPEEPLSTFFRPIPESPVYPDYNPYSAEKEALGELLFWDPVLSGDMNVACASCHHPSHGWADGRRVSVGSDGVGLGPSRQGSQLTAFNSPTVLNVAFAGMRVEDPEVDFIAGPFFWDARAPLLEDQAVEPIKSQVEMLGTNFQPHEAMPLVISRLQNIPEYVSLFDAAFAGPDAISEENIANALATFQRKLISRRTAFDRYLEGDTGALSDREITGLNKFVNGGCARCHQGVLLSDFTIHADQPVLRGLPAVRTAPLRNASLNAPFMHNGSRSSLRDAIEEYDDRDDLEVTFADDDVGDVNAFLRILNNNNFYRTIPAQVPSGLPVGGDIN
ncbi:MAG: cytochrome-c peroxidase [Pseudomonadota bacterium]